MQTIQTETRPGVMDCEGKLTINFLKWQGRRIHIDICQNLKI